MIDFIKIYQLKGLKPKNKGHTNFYECCDLTENTHISEFVLEIMPCLLYKKIIFVLGLLGYFVSWQFGSCYSWIARKGDITGLLAPLFLIGCGTGGSIFPPVTGAVFRYIHYFTISTYQISAE